MFAIPKEYQGTGQGAENCHFARGSITVQLTPLVLKI